MVRIILGAVVGFIVWTIFLFISDAVWIMLSPDFYGTQQAALQEAVNNKTPFTMATAIMVIAGIRSAIFTVITGFIAATISKENFKSPLLLGIFLLGFGSFVHSMIINNVPVWYHILILAPLIPLAILGARLKTQKV